MSDAELEQLVIRDSSEPRAVALREWRVEDFSAAYIAHRDHLVRYARRFLPDGWDAEEVVQDSFLYLMTALPELDSEIGVLRFLKWKTKMLAIDISRSNYRSREMNLESLPEIEADDLDPVDTITRADDAAIVRLALAKLSDRQRNALIATQLEGKSNEVVAQELGLSSNAFRQLLHRARASFKLALVGEAEIKGLSASQVLSIAARRAGTSTISRIGAASIFVAILAMLAPMVLTGPIPTGVIASDRSERLLELSPLQPLSNSEASPGATDEDRRRVGTESSQEDSAPVAESSGLAATSGPKESPQMNQVVDLSEPDNLVNELDEMLIRLTSFESSLAVSKDNGSVLLSLGTDLAASVAYDLESENIVQFVTFTLQTQLGVLTAVPQHGLSVVEAVGGTTRVTYAATDLLVGDFSGDLGYATSQNSNLSRSGYLITLDFDQSGSLVSSGLKLVPRV